MSREHTQHETRQTYTFFDQHERPWHAIVDTRCRPHLAPCTALQPQGWSAPIMPPDDLVRPHPVLLGRLLIDYDSWLERATHAVSDYKQNEHMVAERMFGDQATSAITRRDGRLLSEIGPPPPAVEFVLAAREGNKWILGQDATMPQWANPLQETLPQFRRLTMLENGPSIRSFPNADEEEGETKRTGRDTQGRFVSRSVEEAA